MMTLRIPCRLLPSNKTLYPTHMVASVIMVTAASPSRPVEVLLSVSLALLNPLSAASARLSLTSKRGQSSHTLFFHHCSSWGPGMGNAPRITALG